MMLRGRCDGLGAQSAADGARPARPVLLAPICRPSVPEWGPWPLVSNYVGRSTQRCAAGRDAGVDLCSPSSKHGWLIAPSSSIEGFPKSESFLPGRSVVTRAGGAAGWWASAKPYGLPAQGSWRRVLRILSHGYGNSGAAVPCTQPEAMGVEAFDKLLRL